MSINRIKALEQQIRELKEELADARKQYPLEKIENYTFKNGLGIVDFVSLFGDEDELVLIYNMGKSCRYCTLWADGFNGLTDHLKNRAAFVLVSPDSPAVQQEFAASRNWQFPMVSDEDNSFRKDTGFLSDNGGVIPGIATFRKDENNQIFRTAESQLGPGDNFCIMWDIIDLLPKGVNGWQPQYSYS